MSKYSPKKKPKTMSLITFNKLFFGNEEACRNFFFNIFHPSVFVCPECGCIHYRILSTRPHVYQCKHCYHQVNLFAGTIFQNNKLPLYTLLLGIFLFVTAHNGISAEELANSIDVNRKTAQLLCRKIRYLMEIDNHCFDLQSSFLEADCFYIGGKSHNGKRGLGTDKQTFLIVLATDKENNYPYRFKTAAIESENKENVLDFFRNHINYDKNTILNTDADGAYNIMNKRLTHKSQIINHDEESQKLYWTHKIISNIESTLIGIYHGIAKPYIESYVHEYEWRFNHRYKGKTLMLSVSRILSYKIVMTRNDFKHLFHQSSVSGGL